MQFTAVSAGVRGAVEGIGCRLAMVQRASLGSGTSMLRPFLPRPDTCLCSEGRGWGEKGREWSISNRHLGIWRLANDRGVRSSVILSHDGLT
jgi:hypothetical protein